MFTDRRCSIYLGPKPARPFCSLRIENWMATDRHEAGSGWLEEGWPIHHVQQMLGHANLSQSSTYLNATVKGIEDSMRKLNAHRELQSVAPETSIEHRPESNDSKER